MQHQRTYLRFNRLTECRKVVRGKATKVRPDVLLQLLAEHYVEEHRLTRK